MRWSLASGQQLMTFIEEILHWINGTTKKKIPNLLKQAFNEMILTTYVMDFKLLSKTQNNY